MIVGDRMYALALRMPKWLECVILAIMCWQVSGLFWRVLSPSTDGASLALPRPSPERKTTSREALLGWLDTGDSLVEDVVGDYRLMAVIAGSGGVAVVKGSDGLSVAARVGDDLLPGEKLVSVEPNRITLKKNGIGQELTFPLSEAALLSNALINRTAPENFPRSAQLKPIRIRRGQITAILQGGDAVGWETGLSTAPEGGIRIEKAATQPLARLFQLHDGDLLKRVNQRPLNQIADVSLISYSVGQYTTVAIDLIRHGTYFTQHYDIQP